MGNDFIDDGVLHRRLASFPVESPRIATCRISATEQLLMVIRLAICGCPCVVYRANVIFPRNLLLWRKAVCTKQAIDIGWRVMLMEKSGMATFSSKSPQLSGFFNYEPFCRHQVKMTTGSSCPKNYECGCEERIRARVGLDEPQASHRCTLTLLRFIAPVSSWAHRTERIADGLCDSACRMGLECEKTYEMPLCGGFECGENIWRCLF